MYLEFCGGKLSVANVERGEFSHNKGDRFLWAYGTPVRNLREGEFVHALDELADRFSWKSADRIFAGGYFVVAFDKESGDVQMMRDPMGQRSGYCYWDSTECHLVVSTNAHEVARNVDTDIDRFSIEFLLYQQYVPDGRTIYEKVAEIPAGQWVCCRAKEEMRCVEQLPLPIEYGENTLSEEENIRRLHDEILSVHEHYAGEENVVYLSGGIDSCVMLASLHEICPERVRAVSYRVANTKQDETVYANQAASYLGYSTEVVTVDPSDRRIVEHYEADLHKTNNPYIGNWIFRPSAGQKGEVRYFAGQDTRLHTPSVNGVDMWVLNRLSEGVGKVPLALGKGIVRSTEWLSCLFGLYNASDRRIRYIHLLANALVPEWFVQKRKFMVDPVKYRTWGYDMAVFNAIRRWYETDLEKGMSPRELFNRIVEKKWHEQYVNDIRYMVDMGRMAGVTTLLPFYESDLNRFASTIPWELANRTITGHDGYGDRKVKVNKYVLRKAFEKELPWNVMARAKAVSLSNYLVMNGVLGKKIEQVLREDLASSESFCKRFGQEIKAREIIARSGRWEEKDAYKAIFADYLSALCIYYRDNVVRK